MGNKPREGLRVKQLVSNVLELRGLLLTCWPGFWAVLPSTAHPSRRMSHNPGSYVGFVWRGTRRISLSLSFYEQSALFFPPNLLVSMIFSLNTCPGFESWAENSGDFQPEVMSSLTVCSNTEGLFFLLSNGENQEGNFQTSPETGPCDVLCMSFGWCQRMTKIDSERGLWLGAFSFVYDWKIGVLL